MEKLMLDVVPADGAGPSAVGRCGLWSPHVNAVWVPVTGTTSSLSAWRRPLLTLSKVCAASLENCLVEISDEEVDDDDEVSLARRW